jgi:GMP synthase-like glutamine amidotransferase
MGPLLSNLLTNLGANVISIDLDSAWANRAQLESEVHFGIEAIRHGRLPLERSVPETLLKYAHSNSEIGKIRDRAKRTLEALEAIALPGGDHIEPEFYSNAPCLEIHDYRRTITEFAFLLAADETGKPVSAVCRGQQLLNVYFGGTLETMPEHQYGWSKIQLSDSPHKETLTQVLQEKSSFLAYSNHSQACRQIPSIFHIAASYNGIPKCIMNQSGSIMGFQFHSELPEDGLYSPAIRFYEPWFKAILDRRSSNITSSAGLI